MEIENFSVIAEEFHARVNKIVWCTVATVDRQSRPRSRILHPIWEGQKGWIATGRLSFKAKHLEANPYVSLSYWDPDHKLIYADCEASWAGDQETKERIWDLYKSTPPPLGYDLSMFWSGPDDENYGVLALEPWRIELSSLEDMMDPKVWHRKPTQPTQAS